METPLLVAIKAAPGVDQAVTMGRRWLTLRTPLVTAMEMQRAATHDPVCSGVAPTPSAAASTTATDPPKPTITATMAERTREGVILISKNWIQ